MIRSATAVALLSLAAPAFADFAGQSLLGPLTVGGSLPGNNTGHSDDNDGWYSGTHIFDIWDGGDDVFTLNWPGGNLTLNFTYNSILCDPDLFLYVPGNYDESAFDNLTNSGNESLFVPAAAPGLYYILIDSAAGTEGAYQIGVVPAPGAMAVLAAGLIPLARRRRR